MTPAEHLAEAERLLDQAYSPASYDQIGYHRTLIEKALAHALIAAAAEIGVPHVGTTTGGAVSATPQA